MKTSIAERLEQLQERIAAAAYRCDRAPDDVTLVAVTKTHPPDVIAEVIAAGVKHLGENRVQEAAEKIAALRNEREQTTWHLIGHLQRNKARKAIELFDIIHSIDSTRLAIALDRIAAEQSAALQQRIPILLQVNVSGEASKEGFDLPGGIENNERLALLLADIEQIIILPHLQVQGLMTIAPFNDDPEMARPVFRSLKLLRDKLAQWFPTAEWRHLSMGMTDDFEVAIEEGATIVRVGRAIFGERTYT
ncbi:MAG: YggS family pyridoxal phosphate-dependent enzyme [Chloroflexales bacterium]|nr:YggS family pyridoxal phosphate-dependent enzyme [Chloroflexales bacterium]